MAQQFFIDEDTLLLGPLGPITIDMGKIINFEKEQMSISKQPPIDLCRLERRQRFKNLLTGYKAEKGVDELCQLDQIIVFHRLLREEAINPDKIDRKAILIGWLSLKHNWPIPWVMLVNQMSGYQCKGQSPRERRTIPLDLLVQAWLKAK